MNEEKKVKIWVWVMSIALVGLAISAAGKLILLLWGG